MILAGNFYTILEEQLAVSACSATIALNAAHPVFEGHFPGQPVAPGVCMMQLVQELLERRLQTRLLLQKAANMKFLNMIDPRVQPQVTVDIQYAQDAQLVKASAAIKSETTVFMKFQGTFVIIADQ